MAPGSVYYLLFFNISQIMDLGGQGVVDIDDDDLEIRFAFRQGEP